MYYINENIKDLYRVKFHDNREGVLRLDMNENPGGLPEKVFRRVMEKITPEYLATYPQKDRLMEAIAKHDALLCENISVTAGSDEAMRLIFQCFAKAGGKVVTVAPTFEMYDVYAKMFGMQHVMVEYHDDFTVDVNDICKEIDTQTNIVVLLNPNSPIGTVYQDNEIEEIILMKPIIIFIKRVLFLWLKNMTILWCFGYFPNYFPWQDFESDMLRDVSNLFPILKMRSQLLM